MNAAQKARMVKKIREALGGSESGKTIAVLGLTFKPETDDMRDSPSFAIIPNLVDKGAVIHAHDPQGMKEASEQPPGQVKFFDNISDAGKGPDAIVLMTEWNEYRGLDFNQLKKLMNDNVFIDLRNVYESADMKELGFEYCCIGRPV